MIIKDKVEINLPILDLYPQQQEVYDAIINDEKKYVAMCCHRRFGKDCVGFSTLVSYAALNKGVYFYLAPFRTQVKQIIIEGQMYDGTKFLDLVPDELCVKTLNGKKYKADDLSIELTNGSKIFFKGCDNVDAIVGAGATGVVKRNATHYLNGESLSPLDMVTHRAKFYYTVDKSLTTRGACREAS